MNVTTFTDPGQFADAVQPVLARHPAHSSVLATILDQAVTGNLRQDDALWLLITDAGEPVSAAMHTPPYNLFLTPIPAAARGTAIRLLADATLDTGHDLPGVTAPAAEAEAFAALWRQRTGRPSRPTLGELLYEISDVPAEPGVPGAPRFLTEADVPLATNWISAFNLEAVPDRPAVDAEHAVRQRLTRGWYLLWEDGGEPVSLAGLSRAAAGTGRVGPVYTPGEHRRNGYGAAVTVAATRLCFEQGARRCVLYADVANPTSNGIYRAIGYRPIGETLMIGFY